MKSKSSDVPMHAPDITQEGREARLINMAYDAAEDLLKTGRAPVGIISQLLKLGTIDAQIRMEKMQNEALLAKQKTKEIEDATKREDIAEKALRAFREYVGEGDDNGQM